MKMMMCCFVMWLTEEIAIALFRDGNTERPQRIQICIEPVSKDVIRALSNIADKTNFAERSILDF